VYSGSDYVLSVSGISVGGTVLLFQKMETDLIEFMNIGVHCISGNSVSNYLSGYRKKFGWGPLSTPGIRAYQLNFATMYLAGVAGVVSTSGIIRLDNL
jgi:hypothetical protein